MIPSHRTPTHPGEILREEFLDELGIPQTELASKLGIPVQRINEIGTTPEFWMNMQAAYDLSRNRPSRTIPRLGVRPARSARSPNRPSTAVLRRHDALSSSSWPS